jgi:hypothetical protein
LAVGSRPFLEVASGTADSVAEERLALADSCATAAAVHGGQPDDNLTLDLSARKAAAKHLLRLDIIFIIAGRKRAAVNDRT